MVQRVVVVDGHQVAAENAANLLVGTYVGVGAVMYGLYWLTNYLTPLMLAEDVGVLTYLIAPLSIFLSAIFLLVLMMCAISFEDPLSRMVYAGIISYFSVPLIFEQGWVGSSELGLYISYLLVFIMAKVLLGWIMSSRKVLISAKVLGGVAVFGGLSLLFADSTMTTIKAAGWL